MNILISNDDGIDYEGLRVLVKAMSSIGDVYVVAPNRERSSSSHNITIRGSLRYEERDVPCAKKAYALWGTPVDCVHMALHFLIEEKIDLVLSGINKGANVSTDIIYSGTVAAAREAFIYHVPSIAVSVDSFTPYDHNIAAGYAKDIALSYMKDENRQDYFLNLNVPDLKREEIKGISVCDRMGRMEYHDLYAHEKINGKDHIVILGSSPEYVGDKEDIRIDRVALLKGYVALSPLYNDHVDRDRMKDVERIVKQFAD